jgi:hypothetical protein
MEMAARELLPHTDTHLMVDFCDLYGHNTNAGNAQLAWLLNFAERNLHWMKLKYKRYNHFHKALISSGTVMEIINQYSTAQHRMAWARKKLADL